MHDAMTAHRIVVALRIVVTYRTRVGTARAHYRITYTQKKRKSNYTPHLCGGARMPLNGGGGAPCIIALSGGAGGTACIGGALAGGTATGPNRLTLVAVVAGPFESRCCSASVPLLATPSLKEGFAGPCD